MKTFRIPAALPLALGLLAPTLALAQGGAYTVQGQLGANTPPTKAYLSYEVAKEHKLDSTEVRRGRFIFKGSVPTTTVATLYVVKPGTSLNTRPAPNLDLYLEPGTIKVVSADSLPHATLAGTPLNLDQARLLACTHATTERMNALLWEYSIASPEKHKDKAFEAGFDQRYEAIEAAQNELLKQFIQRNPQSMISLYALKEVGGHIINPATVEPLLAGLAPAVRQSEVGQKYASRIAKVRQLVVGAPAPDLIQPDANGKLVKLSDYRGQYVLLDFWSSRCGPCRQENPNVVANYNKFKDKNFTVLGVSLDRAQDRAAWLKAVQDDHLPWTQVADLKGWNNEAAELYDIRLIPQNLLIGPDGRIVAKNIRGEELGQKLAAVLPATAQ